MPTPARVPPALARAPFHVATAQAHGLTRRMLNGSSWRRVFPRVWVHADHAMSDMDWLLAARLAMPERAVLSHASRLLALGLSTGPVLPVHFTVPCDLHLAIDGIRLHRTAVLPPTDDGGVSPAAAYLQMCADARRIDAIAVGDWLAHRDHVTRRELGELATRDRWRPGAWQVRDILGHLDPSARSLPESKLRTLIVAAGLPAPESNVPITMEGDLLGVVDLLVRSVMLAIEYEGRQHAEDPSQFRRDISRYAPFRRHGLEYFQVTAEDLARPVPLIRRIHARMVELGYSGPPPEFGHAWNALFRPIQRRPGLRTGRR